MLFHPLLLHGIAALKMLFLITAGPASTQDTTVPSRRTLGAAVFTMALMSTPAMIMYNPPGDPPIGDPPLYELMVPPPMDLVVWEPVSKICFYLNAKATVEVDAGLLSEHPAPTTTHVVPATKSRTAVQAAFSTLVSSPFERQPVPELDWLTPGIPTVKALKAKEAEPEPTHLDLWFFDFYVGADGSILLKDDDTLDQLLAGPDDDTLHAWQYVTPMLKFERVCLRKGVYPDVGEARAGFIIGVRWAFLLLTLYTLGTWIVPIPRNLRRAWRAFKRSRRPLRAHRHRRPRHRQ